MSDDRSEQLDGDKLGERPGDPERPGAVGYPPERSLGVEDPSLFDEDDLETRATLRGDAPEPPDADVLLIDPYPIDGSDADETLTADAVTPETGVGEVSADGQETAAEDAAVHLVADTDDDSG